MNQFRFDINDNDNVDDYDGPTCPRVVECKKCSRIMEAPLLGDAKKCCIRSLRRRLETWLNDEYAPYMNPSSLDMALAGMALDALMYDMERGYTADFLKDKPEILKERDIYMNERLAERLRKNGFQVRVKKDGTIDASETLASGEGYLEIEIDELKSDELDVDDDSPWKLDGWK